jgi:hypothetical protein
MTSSKDRWIGAYSTGLTIQGKLSCPINTNNMIQMNFNDNSCDAREYSLIMIEELVIIQLVIPSSSNIIRMPLLMA